METIDCPICMCSTCERYLTSFDVKVSKKEFLIVKCKRCGFAYTNPRPDFSEINSFYGPNYYSYKEVPALHFDSLGNAARKHLDIGCGSGKFLIRKACEGFDSYGVEIDPATIQKAREKGLKVLHIDEFFEFFPDDYFDLITLNQSMEHIHQLMEMMSELNRILKTWQGRLMINVPNLESYDSKLWGRNWRHLDVPRHLYHFTCESITNLLQSYRFNVLDIRTCNMPVLSRNLSYFKGVYTSCRMMITNRGGQFAAAEFVRCLTNILRFIANNKKKLGQSGQFIFITALKK